MDWAAYFGVAISEDHFQSLLPSSDDPDVGFVGNPDGAEGQLPPQSYGVHADPVAAVLRQLAQRCPLVLITKGDLNHQQTKVAQSGLRQLFAGPGGDFEL